MPLRGCPSLWRASTMAARALAASRSGHMPQGLTSRGYHGRRNPRKHPAAQKTKIREKSVLPKSDHKNYCEMNSGNIIRVFLNLGFAKPMFCNSVLFTKATGITKMTKMTKTTQTATSKGADCWIHGNHGKHGNDENHENPGCKT